MRHFLNNVDNSMWIILQQKTSTPVHSKTEHSNPFILKEKQARKN